ncbi:DUF4134 domain-containing protein [Rudanella paleaurantiibacter]|uniref:DUF4134 domain-containing protein n=1 Tax=Rudanella paleaurantiibacter TaxID=2614655 RepID=A0A7J5TST3_9BACT|nr:MULTISPECIES: DUF4134 family protein [Rudanella]KAB7726414.1 DUF4134 domain-containing protein [Rudanella paleaurantiibacter]
MNQLKTGLLLGCCLMAYAGMAQDVNLNGSVATHVGIDSQFTNPILSRMPTFLKFVWAVCGLMALIGGLRIYARVQAGTGDFALETWRLASAVIGIGVVALFLQGWVSYRMPGVTAARFGIDKVLFRGGEDNSEVTDTAPGNVAATPYLPGQDARLDSIRNYYRTASDSLREHTR